MVNFNGNDGYGSQLWHDINSAIAEKAYDVARESLVKLIDSSPSDIEARIRLSSIELEFGNLQKAAKCLADAVPFLSDNVYLTVKLARLLSFAGDTCNAFVCLNHPSVNHSHDSRVLFELGHISQTLGDSVRALDFMTKSLQAGIRSPAIYYFLGLLLEYTNNLPKARESLRTALDIDITFGRAALELSRLDRKTIEHNNLHMLSVNIDRCQPYSIGRASYLFAQYKELEDLGRYREAWQALNGANAIMHYRNPIGRVDEDKTTIDSIIKYCDKSFIERSVTSSHESSPTPIFIVGLPRSGTTLLERMLSNHSRITSIGERTDLFRQLRLATNVHGNKVIDAKVAQRLDAVDYFKLAESYLRQTRWRVNDCDYYIDKLPDNFLLIGVIHCAFPNSPILHMVRDAMDVCFSNYRAMFFDSCAYSYDLGAVASYYKGYAKLMDHWQRVLPGRVFDVSYEELVNSPDVTLRAILSHCGESFDPECLQFANNHSVVATPSSAQVREPLHKRGLGSWRPYAEQLTFYN